MNMGGMLFPWAFTAKAIVINVPLSADVMAPGCFIPLLFQLLKIVLDIYIVKGSFMTVGLQIHCYSSLPRDNSVWGLDCGDASLVHVPNVFGFKGLGGALQDGR